MVSRSDYDKQLLRDQPIGELHKSLVSGKYIFGVEHFNV